MSNSIELQTVIQAGEFLIRDVYRKNGNLRAVVSVPKLDKEAVVEFSLVEFDGCLTFEQYLVKLKQDFITHTESAFTLQDQQDE